jgi:hypothetical protein
LGSQGVKIGDLVSENDDVVVLIDLTVNLLQYVAVRPAGLFDDGVISHKTRSIDKLYAIGVQLPSNLDWPFLFSRRAYVIVRKMKKRLKTEFFALMAEGERDGSASFQKPSAQDLLGLPSWPDLTAAALCLQELIDDRKPILRNDLLTQYRRHYFENGAHDENRIWINQELTGFIIDEKSSAVATGNELMIDSSNLVRLMPLAFRFARYEAKKPRTIAARYDLIHQLTTLSVGHRRASVGAGLLVSVANEIILARRKIKRTLTARRLLIALRLAVKKTFDFYNLQVEYRGETGHYALLQTNRLGRLHLEEAQARELHHSTYVVDTVLMTLWQTIQAKSKRQFHNAIKALGLPDVGACCGALLGLAYGTRFKKKRPRPKPESLRINIQSTIR